MLHSITVYRHNRKILCFQQIFLVLVDASAQHMSHIDVSIPHPGYIWVSSWKQCWGYPYSSSTRCLNFCGDMEEGRVINHWILCVFVNKQAPIKTKPLCFSSLDSVRLIIFNTYRMCTVTTELCTRHKKGMNCSTYSRNFILIYRPSRKNSSCWFSWLLIFQGSLYCTTTTISQWLMSIRKHQ